MDGELIEEMVETKENKDHDHDDVYAPKEHEHDLEDLHISESFYDKSEINNILKDYQKERFNFSL